ncbi:MAG: BamA/TamA family outer membrane protein [Cyanobacteria bacterium SZAS TMP-1]|nr:BamA/TamA family outer membrane protein [Cyanobacteria bacterium SZAS TMP-1]
MQKLKSFKSPAGMIALSLLICMGQVPCALPSFAEIGENHFQLPVNGSLEGPLDASGEAAAPAAAPASPYLAPSSSAGISTSSDSVFHVGATDNVQASDSADVAASNLVVDDVKIEGNRLIPTEEIATVVKTRKGDKYDKEQVLNDLKAIDGMGYFNKNSLMVNQEVTESGLLLKIRVEENAPITQFAITGNNAISTEEISKLFNDQLGRPSNLNALSSAITKVEEAYKEKGFVLAQVTDVKDDPDGSVELVINEGTIDNIVITGNHKTKDFVVRNNIKLKPGSVYNERQLTNDLKKLYANGYFQDIRRSLVPSEKDPGKFTLKVEVDEKRSGSVNAGAGVDSLAGPFGSFGFSDNNFRGRGQVLSLSSQMGSGTLNGISNSVNNGGTNFLPTGRTYNAELSFIEPSLRGSNVSMSNTLFGRNMASMAIDQSMQQTFGLSTNFSKPLVGHWTGNLGLTGEGTRLRDVGSLYQDQNILSSMEQQALKSGLASSAAQASGLAQSYRNQQLKGGVFASISPSVSYDTRDAIVDATKGSYLRFSTTPTAGPSAAFIKGGIVASKFVPLGHDVTLAMNTTAGMSLGGMPQFAQYRLGGYFGNGVRGFRSFSDLGTGTQMLMGTIELRKKLNLPGDNVVSKVLNSHVKLTGWLDYGQVGGNRNMNTLLTRNSMGASVGVGVRIKMPMVGMVRIDYGLPILSTLSTNKFTPRLTFGFGDKF